MRRCGRSGGRLQQCPTQVRTSCSLVSGCRCLWCSRHVEVGSLLRLFFFPFFLAVSEMWKDDEIWLPIVARDACIQGRALFEGTEKLLAHDIAEVAALDESFIDTWVRYH